MITSPLIGAWTICGLISACIKITSARDFTTALNIYNYKMDAGKNEHTLTSVQKKLLSQDIIMETQWEHAFSNMPMIICYLGQLVLISNIRDFDLHKNDTYDYKELGESRFQPALVQLAITIRRSFTIAHDNSNEIRLLMVEIPYRMQQISDLLLHGSKLEHERLFPKTIASILQSSEESTALATEIATIFESTLKLLEEIALSLSATKSFTDEELNKLKNKKTVLEKKKEHAEEIKKMLEIECKKVEKIAEKCRKKYEAALKDIPTGFKAVFLGLIQDINLGEIAKTLSPLGIAKGISDMVKDHKKSHKNEDNVQHLIDNKNAIQYAENIVRFLEEFKNNDQTESLAGNRTAKQIAVSDILAILKQSLATNIKSMSERKPSSIKSQVSSQFKLIEAEIVNLEKKIKIKGTDIVKEIKLFKASCNVFIINSNNIIKDGFNETNYNPKVATPPPENKGSDVGKNERYKAEKWEERVEQQEARYNDLFDRSIKQNEKLGDLLAELTSINITTLDLEKIKGIINKAIKKISDMQSLWIEISSLFQTMAIVIKKEISEHAKRFANNAKSISNDIQENDEMVITNNERKDMMFEVLRVSAYSEACLTVTTAYVNISMEFVLKGVGKAVGLQALELNKNQKERYKLNNDAKDNQQKIMRYIKGYRKEYTASVKQQKKEIKELFKKNYDRQQIEEE